MVAIKLLVASLASLALARPIEPRSPDLGSQLSQRIHNLGDTVGDLLGEVFDANEVTEVISQVLTAVDEKIQQLSHVVQEVADETRHARGDVVEAVNESGLGVIVGQLGGSVDRIQQMLLNAPLPESLRTALKDLLGDVTSLKDDIPSTDATSDVIDNLGNLEDTLGGLIGGDNDVTQS